MFFFTLVAEEWSISKAEGEPADFGHDMERHQEVENDGKYAGLADLPPRGVGAKPRIYDVV